MATENLTTYTEVDPNSRVTKTADRVTSAAIIRNESAYLYDDKGAGHFNGDFEHLIDIKVTSCDVDGFLNLWGLYNLVGDRVDAYGNDALAVYWYVDDSTQYIFMHGRFNAGASSYQSYVATLNTAYYLTIKRVGSTTTCKIYSDSARQNLLSTLTSTPGGVSSLRYVYAMQSYTVAGDAAISGYAENLDLQEGAIHEASATLAGAGTLANIGSLIKKGVSALQGAATVAIIASLILTSAAPLGGESTLTTEAHVIRADSATLSGEGQLTTVAEVATILEGSATLEGIGSLTTDAHLTRTGVTALSGAGTLAATAIDIPTAITQAASNIGNTTARINGQISDDGGESCEARFRYRKTGGAEEQTFIPITPVAVTPGEINDWLDVDVSAYVPAGATGVLLHLVNNWVSSNGIGVRKNGSTDNRHPDLRSYCHCWAAIGVDANRVFEAYIEAYSPNLRIYLVGYTKSGVTFFDNAYDKSLGTPITWTDIDCSTEAPNAIGLIFEVTAVGSCSFGFRKNGSSDNRVEGHLGHNTFSVIIGCDSSQICEGFIGSTDSKFYLVGYITSGAVFNTNATNVSLTTTGSWLDLAALPPISTMGFIEVFNVPPTANNYGLRKNGSTEDIYRKGVFYPWAFVECDENGLIEGKIEDLAIDFFVVGHALGVADWTTTEWQNTLGTNDTYYKDLINLDQDTEYEFQTRAKNGAGEGAWSGSAYFETTLVLEGAAALSGQGTLATVANLTLTAIIASAGEGQLTTIATLFRPGAASVSGEGQLVIVATLFRPGSATLSGQGQIAVIAYLTKTDTATISGEGQLSIAACLIATGNASLTGEGQLTATGEVVGAAVEGSAILSGVGTVESIACLISTGVIALQGEGLLSSIGSKLLCASAEAQGEGSLQITAACIFVGVIETTGEGSLTATAVIPLYGEATLTGEGSLSIVAFVFLEIEPALQYTVELRDGSGNLVAILENARDISYAQVINAPHSLTFNLPANDSKTTNILLSNEIWLRDTQTDTVIRKLKLQRKMDVRT